MTTTTTTIRVSTQVRDQLSEMATASGISMQELVERSLEMYRRAKFLEALNLAYANLQQNANEWQEFQSEQTNWDETIGDGLEDDQWQ
jgi:predicted transcriptional regulator